MKINDKGLSLGSYRSIDLTIFTCIMVVFELISIKAIPWLNEIYTISLFFAISLLILMRWNYFALIPIVCGSVAYCAFNNSSIEYYVVYSIGGLFILLNMLWFLSGKEKFKNNYVVICFILTGYFALEFGRTLVATIAYQYSFFDTLIRFLGTDALNVLIAFFIVFIARKQDGIFEDQIKYLKRVHEEEKNKESEEE